MGFLSRMFGNKEEQEHCLKLERELDDLREEMKQALAKERQTIQGLWLIIDAEKEQKTKLQKEISRLQEEKRIQEAEMTAELDSMKKRVEEHEKNYEVISRVMVMAQKDADEKVSEAQKEAIRITDEAKEEAFVFQQKAEADIQEQYQIGRKKFSYAKNKLVESMTAINQTHEKLLSAYTELGDLLKKMPVQIENLFPNGNLEFLLEEKDPLSYQEEVIDGDAKIVGE